MNTPKYWKIVAERLEGDNPLQANFAWGHHFLLLKDSNNCINAYSKAIESILNQDLHTQHETFTNELTYLENLNYNNSSLKDNITLYLNIAWYLLDDSSDKEIYYNLIQPHKIHKEPFKQPVIIVAGGASLMDKTETETYRNYFRKMMHGFTGTIISGGTTAGIPGLVGEVKEALEKQRTLDYNLVGYLPGMLPTNAAKSKAYDTFCETDSDHFSFLEILSYWCDLVCSGIHPSEVVLVGINGGDISALEYRIALSLGAKVKILANSGRAANELLEDKYWKTHQNLSEVMPD